MLSPDLLEKMSHVDSLESARELVGQVGPLNDEKRQALLRASFKLSLPAPCLREIYRLCMGDLRTVLHPERCQQWWEAVLEKNEALGVAQEQGLSFSSRALQGWQQESMLGDLIDAGRSSLAAQLWSSLPDEDKENQCDSLYESLGVRLPGNAQAWVDACLGQSPRPSAFKRMCSAVVSTALVFHAQNLTPLKPWLDAFFPLGLPQEKARSFVETFGRQHTLDEHVREALDLLLVPLRAIHDQQALGEITPLCAPASDRHRL